MLHRSYARAALALGVCCMAACSGGAFYIDGAAGSAQSGGASGASASSGASGLGDSSGSGGTGTSGSSGRGGAAGASGSSGGAAAGGDAGHSGSDGGGDSGSDNGGNSGSDTGGSSGSGGGESGSSSGGSAGQSGGGSSGAGGSSGSCTSPISWFPDGDGDGVGRTSGQVVACDPPSNGVWVTEGGDCNDDNPNVNPKHSDYEPSSYVPSAGGESWDYDCSGTEVSDPSQLGAAPKCSGLALGGCTGSGFVARSDRSGTGINALCGSTQIVSCVANGLSCSSVASVTTEPHRCR